VSRAAGVALAGAGLLLAAFAFDAATLFVPAVALLLLSALSAAWIWLAGRGVRLSRTLEAERVVEEEPVEARIQLAGWLGLPGAQVDDPLAGGPIMVSSAGWGRRVELRIVSRFSTRGRKQFAPPRLRLGDQLGLVRVVRQAPGPPDDVLVLPRTERIAWRGDGGRRGLPSPGRASSPEPTGATEVDGVTRYRPGTPASRIHWPALARGAGLLERRLLAEAESSPLVVLDARCAGPPELLDAAVRAAASLTLELARRVGCDLLLPGQRRPLHVARDLSAWPEAHARLALVEGGEDSIAPYLTERIRTGAIFYVAARHMRIPGPLAARRAGMIMILPHELCEGRPGAAMLDVSGCAGFPLRAMELARSSEVAA
jgi:uncharacterized protein (DUF58 family)